MSSSVLVSTRKDSPRGVWRNPSIEEELELDDASLKSRIKGGTNSISTATEQSRNVKFKIHNKFFRLTRKLLRSEVSTTASSYMSSSTREDCKHHDRPADDGSLSTRKLRRKVSPSTPIYSSTPHKLGKTARLSFYDRARAEAVSLTYANPQMSSALLLTKISLGSFDLDKPSNSTRLTIVLDLDETLVHTIANYSCCSGRPDGFKRDVHQSDRTESQHTMTVFYRPFLVPFLRTMKKMHCEIIVFTAGTQGYTDAVLDVLDPYHDLIDHRLYRQHASGHPLRSNMLCKNLQLLGRDLNSCLLIDDTPDTFCLQPANGWAISPYGKKLVYSDIGTIISKGSEEDYRRFCPPAILEGRKGHSAVQSSKVIVGCAREDYALLNAMCLVKELLRSQMAVPKFTLYYEKQINAALLHDSDSLFIP